MSYELGILNFEFLLFIFFMVEILLITAAVYLVLGLLFVIPFLMKGLNKVDEGAHGSTIGFKIIIIPGVIVFWPVLLKKWIRKRAE
jgi:hypothetical protein